MVLEHSPSLRVRLNDIDYINVAPGALDNSSLNRVPVLRIYGDSSTGQKACVHVHNVYPYFYIEYCGDSVDATTVKRYISKLFHSLNQALTVSLQRKTNNHSAVFIRAIILVKGVHFYGFHASHSPFLKIYLADPSVVSRAAAILQTGTVMSTRFRVFESHISYPLQFMCDFNLYGCGWLELGEVWQREDRSLLFASADKESDAHFKPSPYFRQTHMQLEVDVAAHQILNRHGLSERNIHHELKIPALPPPSESLVASVRELWDDERRRRVSHGLPPSPEIPADPSERSRGKGGDWVQEAEFWDGIRMRLQREGKNAPTLAAAGDWERYVMTTFESIEALWEDIHKVWKPAPREPQAHSAGSSHETTAEVDEPNSFEPMTQLSIIPDIASDHDGIDVDEVMLATQAVKRFIADEQGRDHEADTPHVPLDTNAEEEVGETAADFNDLDGRPVTPHKQASSARASPFKTPSKRPLPTSRPGTPYRPLLPTTLGTPLKAANPFFSAFGHLTAPYDRLKSPTANLPTTPAKPPASQTSILKSVSNTRKRITNMLGDVGPSYNYEDNLLPAVPIPSIIESISQDPGTDDGHVSLSRRVNSGVDASFSIVAWPTLFSVDNNEMIVSKKQKLDVSQYGASAALVEPSPFFLGVSSAHELSDPSSHISRSGKLALPDNAVSCSMYQYRHLPPSTSELLATLHPRKIYQDPWYSVQADAPERPREYAGLVYHLKGGQGLDTLPDWQETPDISTSSWKTAVKEEYGWEYYALPPSAHATRAWLTRQAIESKSARRVAAFRSQIRGPTQHSLEPKGTPRRPARSARREKHHLTVLSMELFAPGQYDRKSDPASDSIAAIFYAFHDADIMLEDDEDSQSAITEGILVVQCHQFDPRRLRDISLEVASDELDLINRFVDLVCDMDPDVIAGWEIQMASWGYLTARSQYLDLDMTELISRAPSRTHGGATRQWDYRQTSTFKIVGRHVLNVWRVMRSEQTLRIYTFENVAYHLLRERFPFYTSATLADWFNSPSPYHATRLLAYFRDRTVALLKMLDAAEVVTKTAEFARVFGVDFFSVMSRGSQFKVESFMLRIAKAENFVLLAPSKDDVGKQNAIECMPLIMEPLSAFYSSPLLVLDFQSLYPSIMIAYNYCYSTCLGRVQKFNGTWKFGVTEHRLQEGLLNQLRDHINVAPNGIMYAKPEVRQGLLGRMLKELLDTRVMVKQAMKRVKDDKALRRVLDARQLGLKFISNVTYGYTSATFSGRMPAVEIADSIVQSGRETLEKAISVIHATKRWGAKVVYGDTDSLFIYLPGKTKEQAFRIGYEMSDTISAMNPAPIKLKFEKVYLPCLLMAKKRYVGWKYENPDDQEATFDAKGIETVRRDGCIAQAKMTEQCLKILFRTQDLSKVKEYCYDSWSKILDQNVTIQDFIIAKEVKMGTYSKDLPPLPGVTVAARRTLADPNDEAQYGERVPYVVVRGAPGSKLLERSYDPREVLNDARKHLDAVYYISRILIPPLERIFSLVGADVRAWYDDMPKSVRTDVSDLAPLSPRKRQAERAITNRLNIEEHFSRTQCISCGAQTAFGLCDGCRFATQKTFVGLALQVRDCETRLKQAQKSCRLCTSSRAAEPVRCESLDCPGFYERLKAESSMELAIAALEAIEESR